MNLQNKLITLGIAVLVITLIVIFNTPSGVDRLKDKLEKLEIDNKKQQITIDSAFSAIDSNELEKARSRDIIDSLITDNLLLKDGVQIEKQKLKEISGRYKKLSNDSLSLRLNKL